MIVYSFIEKQSSYIINLCSVYSEQLPDKWLYIIICKCIFGKHACIVLKWHTVHKPHNSCLSMCLVPNSVTILGFMTFLLGSTVVSPYVGMARKQNGGYNASISVQTLIFHLVVNSMRLKTVRSARWCCPNYTMAPRFNPSSAQNKTPTNSREIPRGCAF